MRKIRDEQAPVTPFEIMDFDDDLDDIDGMPSDLASALDTGHYGLGLSNQRHYSYHVPQDTPSSVSILGPSNTEPRPLLYSTLRKKSALKNQYSTISVEPTWTVPVSLNSDRKLMQTLPPLNVDYRQYTTINTSSPLSTTLPKSILTNRNSMHGGETLPFRPMTTEVGTNTISTISIENGNLGHNNGFATICRPVTTTTAAISTIETSENTRPVEIDFYHMSTGDNNNDQHSQPKSLSKSLNNFYM